MKTMTTTVITASPQPRHPASSQHLHLGKELLLPWSYGRLCQLQQVEGGRGSPLARSRGLTATRQAPVLVWKRKTTKEKPLKKVSFADPIATELRAPRPTLRDDSILLIMGNTHTDTILPSPIPPMFDEMTGSITGQPLFAERQAISELEMGGNNISDNTNLATSEQCSERSNVEIQSQSSLTAVASLTEGEKIKEKASEGSTPATADAIDPPLSKQFTAYPNF